MDNTKKELKEKIKKQMDRLACGKIDVICLADNINTYIDESFKNLKTQVSKEKSDSNSKKDYLSDKEEDIFRDDESILY